MTRPLAPGRLAGVLGLAIACLPARGASEPCVARAELGGDAEVVKRVGVELARLGVERGTPAPGCRGVVARVESDRDGGIAVAIQDGSRRSEGRVVSDVAMAASWIDSWLHDDLDGNAWLISAPVRVSTAPGVTAPRVEATRTGALDRVSMSFAYEHVWNDDDSSATGGSLGACVHIGAFCLGGRARYVREPERTLDLTGMARSDLSVLATASVPMRIGRMMIAPELGLGIARTRTRRVDGCEPAMPTPNCDPGDPMCVPTNCDPSDTKLYVGDHFSNTTYTPRVTTGIRISVPLFDRVWLDALAALAVAPFAHGDAFATDLGINADGTIGPGGMGSAQFSLPGESSFGFQIGIGLRVGGR